MANNQTVIGEERSTPVTESSPTVRCGVCSRLVFLVREVDGFGRPREDRPFRYSYHAGHMFGRPCQNNGEQYLGDEP